MVVLSVSEYMQVFIACLYLNGRWLFHFQKVAVDIPIKQFNTATYYADLDFYSTCLGLFCGQLLFGGFCFMLADLLTNTFFLFQYLLLRFNGFAELLNIMIINDRSILQE